MHNISSGRRKWGLFLAFILVFGIGLFAGKTWDIKNQISNDSGQVAIAKVIDLYSQTRSDKVSFDQFWDIWNIIKEKHVAQPVDEVKLFYGALKGMVAGLDDEYSVYFPPAEAEEFSKDLSGEFEGIGAEIGLKDNQLVIVAPLTGSPAEKAGLKTGDKILLINDEDTFGFTLDKAVAKIRGPKGSTVKLTITSDGLQKAREVNIIRAKINVPTIVWEMKSNNMAYLRISYFNEKTWDEFDKAVKEILVKNPTGLILDMRSNPGGYLDTSVMVASEWIEKGVVVRERFSDNKENKYDSNGSHRLTALKTIVLVDEGTASGAEIVAGALQDYKLAQIVGMKTYGKGSVQEFEPLPDGSALKITVAKWFTPLNQQIDKKGITPDVVLEKMAEEVKNDKGDVVDYKDLGLEKALDMLK